jgi:hypothetical protein
METKVITAEMREKLTHPLPAEAVTPHPTKKFLSSIKSIYVTERLNDVFGTGTWKVETNIVDKDNKMVVVKVKFSIPSYGIEYECFGGNDNPDLGDAYKGATTDALTKIASWMGIGGEVFRGEVGKTPAKPVASKPSSTPPQRKKLTIDTLMDEEYLKGLCKWLRSKAEGKRLEDVIVAYYDCDEEVVRCITNEYLRTNV